MEELVIPQIEYTELSGQWHKTRDYTISYPFTCSDGNNIIAKVTLTVVGVITGCGLVQMHGISNISESNFDLIKDKLEHIKSDYKTDGAGCIMCTLGAQYYNKEDLLLKLGFVKVSEYANYRHGQSGHYKQRMYLLTY